VIEMNGNSKALAKMRGFSLTELVVALAVMMIVTAIAIPNLVSSLRQAHLKGAVTDYASLIQSERLRSVDDDRYYSIYILTANGAQEGFVDIYPQNVNGASGSSGTTIDPKDPAVVINPEISQQAVGAAPNTAALQSKILPANSPITPLDGSTAASPVTFGPRGLPCKPAGGVCDSLGGPQAYWTFFQSGVTQAWGAVTVSPAGRVQRWLYTGGTNGVWATY
jgi:type II secretory pathway pseudopilin PulG